MWFLFSLLNWVLFLSFILLSFFSPVSPFSSLLPFPMRDFLSSLCFTLSGPFSQSLRRQMIQFPDKSGPVMALALALFRLSFAHQAFHQFSPLALFYFFISSRQNFLPKSVAPLIFNASREIRLRFNSYSWQHVGSSSSSIVVAIRSHSLQTWKKHHSDFFGFLQKESSWKSGGQRPQTFSFCSVTRAIYFIDVLENCWAAAVAMWLSTRRVIQRLWVWITPGAKLFSLLFLSLHLSCLSIECPSTGPSRRCNFWRLVFLERGKKLIASSCKLCVCALLI